MDKSFFINNRFRIEPSLHLLDDLEAKSKIRLEPRLIKLLCLLCENEGKLLGRELLVREIWNDYGGGDEALTQGISILRKLLLDDRRTLIETIPKKGYVMHASITGDIVARIVQKNNTTTRRSGYRWVAIIAFAVLGLLLFLLTPEPNPDDMKHKTSTIEKKTDPPTENKDDANDSKNSSPPPGGKDDAKKQEKNKKGIQ